jgi:hypothetical protein
MPKVSGAEIVSILRESELCDLREVASQFLVSETVLIVAKRIPEFERYRSASLFITSRRSRTILPPN